MEQHDDSGLPKAMPNSFMKKFAAAEEPSTKAVFHKNPALALEVGAKFHHYEIRELLGQGGMGVVYRAFDSRLQRDVALKLLRSSIISEVEARRFVEEARSTARLQHPNIVHLLEVGTTPTLYFTMEYVEGSTLAALVKDETLTPKAVARTILKTAMALYEAHKKGIVHRDIKPSNIMIDKDGEPKIMDFGLAKNTREDPLLSQSGDVIGTPLYMSPEQVKNKRVDKRSDVYSLGVTLYEALVGFPPFAGNTNYRILSQIVGDKPASIRKFAPDVPADLELICFRCLAKSPRQRYASMRLLARDLENFLANRPVMAKRQRLMSHWRKLLAIDRVTGIFALILFGMAPATQVWQKEQRRFYLQQEERKVHSSAKELQLPEVWEANSHGERKLAFPPIFDGIVDTPQQLSNRRVIVANRLWKRAAEHFDNESYLEAVIAWHTALTLDPNKRRELGYQYYEARSILYKRSGFLALSERYRRKARQLEDEKVSKR